MLSHSVPLSWTGVKYPSVRKKGRSSVTFSQNAGQDLVITLSNGETVTVVDHFRSGLYDMEEIEFAGGTVLNFQEIVTKSFNDQNGAGDDSIKGSFDSDIFYAGAGNDTLNGGEGADTYIYSLGDGNDVISDSSYAGGHLDRLVFTDVNAEDVTFSQNAGQDLVITLSNGETVTVTDHFQNSTNDMEEIEFADGTVLDLQAIRIKTLEDQKDTGTVRGTSGADTYHHALGDGSYTIIDVSSSSANDRLVFSDVNSTDVTFTQNSSHDLIIKLSNGETITVQDHFYSGTYDIEGIEFADGTVLNSQAIREKILTGGSGNDSLIGFSGDDVMRGNLGDDYLFGSSGNDSIHGDNGNDTIDGGEGDDNHYGGDGDDLILGSLGDDFFDGGTGRDTIDFSYSSSNFNLDLSQSNVVFESGFTEQVLNFENIIGGSGNNTLTGSGEANVIEGGAGNDVLYGGEGDDTLDGGAGNDSYYGGAGNDYIIGNTGADVHDGGEDIDTIDFTYNTSDYTIDLSQSQFVSTSGFVQQVLNFENIIGGSGNNTLTGSNANNVIEGGAGNDRIVGLEGDDTLTGSSGADVFVFNTLTTEGADTITDFELGTDTLELAGSTYDDLTFVDTGSGTRVEWDNGSVEVDNIAIASLTEDQFAFV